MMGKAWTTSEVKRLHEMRAQGLKAWAIAQELGRTENAIYSFIAAHRGAESSTPPPPRLHEWTTGALHRLHELAADGATAEEAAMDLCRPLYAVRNKAAREGISFGKKAKDSFYRLEREGYSFKRDAIQGSAKLRDAIMALQG